MSRNKREGQYIGHYQGKAYRAKRVGEEKYSLLILIPDDSLRKSPCAVLKP